MNTTTTAAPLYLDPDQPVAARVVDLVGRMTTAEKLGQLVYNAPAIPRLGVPDYRCGDRGGGGGANTVLIAINTWGSNSPRLLRRALPKPGHPKKQRGEFAFA